MNGENWETIVGLIGAAVVLSSYPVGQAVAEIFSDRAATKRAIAEAEAEARIAEADAEIAKAEAHIAEMKAHGRPHRPRPTSARSASFEEPKLIEGSVEPSMNTSEANPGRTHDEEKSEE